MHGTYVGDGRVLISPIWRGKLYAPSDDISLTPDLLIDGCFDIAFTNFVMKAIDKSMVTVDIGANIGYTTVLLGKYSKKTYGYEAGEKNFRFLMQNIHMNYLGNTEIYNKAVSSEEGKITFYEPERFRGSGGTNPTMAKSFLTLAPFDNLASYSVDTVSIDEHLAHEEVIDFIKMDIEGGEYQAFLGMANKIEQGKIKAISYELNPSCLGDDFEPLKELMKFYQDKKGSRFFTMDGEGQVHQDTIDNLFSREHVDQLLVSFV
ncbi:FkbM family methyltransferase [Paenibacillus xylanexedens]|uniref:FkbM family methyltransferase n=1 Tax=Paenibacillus xylanexedens TaxID=528191 RepID=UPI000F53D226|nr:FkbM family methyltransferase [Paenibacillus xylanexedens]RPK20033.1 hypothetical protein EDO6_06550 [Paenibacillus xylanexedens]